MLDWDFNSKPVTGWANSILLAHVMFNIQWDPICLLFMKPDMFDRFSQAEVKQKEFEDGTGALTETFTKTSFHCIC